MAIALSFLFAFLVSAALVPVFRTVAVRLGYVVTPSTEVHASARPKARFGGAAVALTLFGSAILMGASEPLTVLLLCSAGLFLVGVASELFALKPSTKLVAVIATASVFLFFDYRLEWTESLTIDSMVTLFWIVGITSAFNLLDNMDGLCSGIALIAGTAFLFTVLPSAPDSALFLKSQYLGILLGSIAGFLLYNVHPASVALGESGSLVIGLNMAAMTLQIAPGRGSDLLSVVAVPMLVLSIPIADGVLAALSRLAPAGDRTPVETSSKRLVAIGLSERSAVTLLWLLSGLSGAIAVMAGRSQNLTGLMAAMFTIAIALFAVFLARVKIHEQIDPDTLPASIIPLGIDLGYRRRVFEVLLDVALVSVAYYGAFRLRFDAPGWADNSVYFRQSFPVVLGIQIVALFASGAYRGMWRYFSLSDSVIFAKAVFVGVVTSQVAVLYLYRFEGYAADTFVVYAMMLFLLLGGSRASFRLVSEFLLRQRHSGRRLVIYGAGDAGMIAVRHLLSDARTTYRIVGFVDDDVRKRGVRVHGYRVIGGYDHLVGMILAREIDAVALAGDRPEPPGLASLCARHDVLLQRFSVNLNVIAAMESVAAAAGASALGQREAGVLPFKPTRHAEPAAAAAMKRRQVALPSDALHSAGSVPSVEQETAPVHVAHIITRLILGGAQENTIYTAIGQHQDSRFDVTLICGIDEVGEGNMFAEVSRAGVKTVVLPSLVREVRPLTDLRACFDLYRFLKQGSYRIVHTHSSKAGVVGRLAARLAGVPVVVHTIHGMPFHEFQSPWKNRLFVFLERLCAPLSQKIISVSGLLGETALRERIGRRDQHVTVFSGIELDRFLSVGDRLSVAEAKASIGIPPDALVVGKIARLFPLKGHEQFLAAAVEIARQVPNVRFLLVGDGPLRDSLKADGERLGIGDRLVMVGRVPPGNVPDYIQAMDVVVHTSLREGIARVLPQAGAVGKAVVTFHLDGAPEVIRDGVSGYLVAPLDTGQIAERTVELLRDSDRRQAFGRAGRAFAVAHFSVERMVALINALYVDLLSRPSDQPQRKSGRERDGSTPASRRADTL